LPAAFSHGIGAEIQRPRARVVVGGLISSTLLTLLVLPAIYAWLGGAHRERPDEAAA
jgi:heavy metal efflux system protein